MTTHTDDTAVQARRQEQELRELRSQLAAKDTRIKYLEENVERLRNEVRWFEKNTRDRFSQAHKDCDGNFHAVLGLGGVGWFALLVLIVYVVILASAD